MANRYLTGHLENLKQIVREAQIEKNITPCAIAAAFTFVGKWRRS